MGSMMSCLECSTNVGHLQMKAVVTSSDSSINQILMQALCMRAASEHTV